MKPFSVSVVAKIPRVKYLSWKINPKLEEKKLPRIELREYLKGYRTKVNELSRI